MKKKIYYIDSKTKEFLQSKEIDTKFFGVNVPNTTDIKPLETKDNFAVCFNKGKWEYVEDNRSKTAYSITDKSESKVDYLGSIKDGFTLLKPQETDKWDGLKWIDDLELLKTQKLSNMKTTYQIESTANVLYKNVLYKGGDSSASAIAGAVNLAQSLQESNVKIIASDDSANEMSFSEALELSGLIARSWRTAFFRYKELKLEITNSKTVEELNSISWEEV